MLFFKYQIACFSVNFKDYICDKVFKIIKDLLNINCHFLHTISDIIWLTCQINIIVTND